VGLPERSIACVMVKFFRNEMAAKSRNLLKNIEPDGKLCLYSFLPAQQERLHQLPQLRHCLLIFALDDTAFFDNWKSPHAKHFLLDSGAAT
jgi:hypothetical protein